MNELNINVAAANTPAVSNAIPRFSHRRFLAIAIFRPENVAASAAVTFLFYLVGSWSIVTTQVRKGEERETDEGGGANAPKTCFSLR